MINIFITDDVGFIGSFSKKRVVNIVSGRKIIVN
jgi:hypothetical protein